MKRWPVALAVLMLGFTWAFLASRSQAEPALARKPFAELPLSLGSWTGHDFEIDDKVLAKLNLTDYLMRGYTPKQPARAAGGSFESQLRQAAAPVSIYVGYYGSQRTGSTYHSPKNCLPGSGWVLKSSEPVKGVLPGRPEAVVNRVVIEKGFDRQLILYWYQDRGRIVADEYAAKAYLIWDATTRNRTDGSLVRVSTTIVGSEAEAFAHAVAFVQEAFPQLAVHLPG